MARQPTTTLREVIANCESALSYDQMNRIPGPFNVSVREAFPAVQTAIEQGLLAGLEEPFSQLTGDMYIMRDMALHCIR